MNKSERKRSNMKIKKMSGGLTACVVSILAITNATNAQGDPTVSMQLDNFTTYADVINLGTMTIPGDPTESGSIGIYSFDVESSGTTANVPVGTFWTTCLSPAGTIESGSGFASYNYESFAQANNGINPSAWAWNNDNSNPQYWGIQNANFLWKQVLGNNNEPTSLSADQATGLVLAMYAALYNSSGYGMLGSTQFFNPNFGTSSISGNVTAVENAYTTYLALLNANAVENNLANGYVLVPTSQSQGDGFGQEFIIMAPGNVTVPESAGMGLCAGLGALVLSLRYSVSRKLAKV
jgi:hypothetical protein